MNGAGLALPAVTMSEAQAYVRIETGEEEAVVAGLIRTASALCEAFLNRVLIARGFTLELPASSAWQRLDLTPVQSIELVEALDSNDIAGSLPGGGYTIDIDLSGDGWIRVTDAADFTRIRVSGTAGMAQDENGVPEPIRQGVLRLVAHLFTVRDGDGGAVPAAVIALWQPYRRMRIV